MVGPEPALRRGLIWSSWAQMLRRWSAGRASPDECGRHVSLGLTSGAPRDGWPGPDPVFLDGDSSKDHQSDAWQACVGCGKIAIRQPASALTQSAGDGGEAKSLFPQSPARFHTSSLVHQNRILTANVRTHTNQCVVEMDCIMDRIFPKALGRRRVSETKVLCARLVRDCGSTRDICAARFVRPPPSKNPHHRTPL